MPGFRSFRFLAAQSFFACTLIFHAANSSGATVTTTSFTSISNAVFTDVGSGAFTPITAGSVTITANRSGPTGGFLNWGWLTPRSPDDPGDGTGFWNATNYPAAVGPLTLNFSTTVAAFGVTFFLFPESAVPNAGLTSPALLKVYDGLNGTGNLLGSITTVGWLGTADGNADFVAVWSDSRNIRSAVLSGAFGQGYAVDGYGLSLTPAVIPEPGILSLAALGVLGLLLAGRKRPA